MRYVMKSLRMALLLCLVTLSAFAVLPAQAAGSSFAGIDNKPWRLALLPLDMPMEEALNGEFLEGIYTEHLQPFIRSSLRPDGDPVVHIVTRLSPRSGAKVDSDKDIDLDLWFSSQETGRRAFWLRMMQPFVVPVPEKTFVQNLDQRFGTPARALRVVDGSITWVVTLYVAPETPSPQKDAVIAGLAQDWPTDYHALIDVQSRDLRGKAKLLGPNFRGALVSYGVNKNGQVSSSSMELIDLPLAASVLNLGQ